MNEKYARFYTLEYMWNYYTQFSWGVMFIVDGFSRMIWMHPLRSKSETSKFEEWCNFAEN